MTDKTAIVPASQNTIQVNNIDGALRLLELSDAYLIQAKTLEQHLAGRDFAEQIRHLSKARGLELSIQNRPPS